MLLCLLLCASAAGAPDRVYLRDGRTLEGQVLGERSGVYRVLAGAHLQIPKHAVKFVLYGTRARADQYLGLSRAARLGKDDDRAAVTILPTEAFGRALVPAVSAATQSIWIAAYYLSGSRVSPIKDFYEILQQKARAGLDVVIVAEYGQATPPSVKYATRNFGHQLASSGVKFMLLGDRKAQHKKLLIVDERLVFLGSSNLTLAGTRFSNEMNIRVDSPAFVRQVVYDFRRLKDRAVPLEKWKE
jgi:phosphatidylserine/phosphatidylglycerophosphate/cardiolipin synthase-like enzyme